MASKVNGMEVVRQNIQWHKTEAYYYESTHPENYNIFEQRRLRGEIKALIGEIDTMLPVLDLGSGTGHLVAHMRRCGIEPVACDLSVDMLRENAAETKVLCDAARLPFDDKTFGAVVAYSVIHHFPDPSAVMREVARVAADRCVLYFDHDHFILDRSGRIGRYGFTVKDLCGWLLWLALHPRQFGRLLHYVFVGRRRHLDNISQLGNSEDEGRVNRVELANILQDAGFDVIFTQYGSGSYMKAHRGYK